MYLSDRMKSLNAKRIAALAASLALGIAVAGPVSFSNIPIINSAGQPVVQIVVGSTAQPSDGVVAANIAAVIGNLAFTSTPVTATVQGTSGLGCAATAASCSLSNQQVYLSEKGSVTSSGSFSIKALIGSVLNGGALNYQNLANTKSLTSGSSSQYVYPEYSSSPFNITYSPTAVSVYSGIGLGATGTVTANSNGGGVSFSSLSQTSGGLSYDNIMRIGSSQLPSLMSSSGTHSESEYIWIGGFPVYNQKIGSFELVSPVEAYQVQFGNPLQVNNSKGQVQHPSFLLLGQNWTVNSYTLPSVGSEHLSTDNYTVGGKLVLAKSSTPLKTIYVGQNLTSGPFKVVLQDLSYPDSSGTSSASVGVYNNGVLTNETSIYPGNTITVNSSGTLLYVYVKTTFPGLYSYQKWADMQLYSQIYNITSGKLFNQSDPNWKAALQWTVNQTSVGGSQFAPNAELEGIVLYSNMSKATTLSPGGSINIIDNPAAWKLTFAGDSLGNPGAGNTNYDPVSFSTSATSSLVQYANAGGSDSASVTSNGFAANGEVTGALGTIGNFLPDESIPNVGNVLNDSYVSEPESLLTVSSSSGTAFSINPQDGSTSPSASTGTVNYNLDAYEYIPKNVIAQNSNSIATMPNSGMAIQLYSLSGGSSSQVLNPNWVDSSHSLTVTITGYKMGQTSKSSPQVTFNPSGGLPSASSTVGLFAGGANQILSGWLFNNVTDIKLSEALPSPGVQVNVYETSNVLSENGMNSQNSILMGELIYRGPTINYMVNQYPYQIATTATSANVLYSVGTESNMHFQLYTSSIPSDTAQRATYFTYNVPEVTEPSQTSSAGANITFDITNQSTLTTGYWLNQTNGNGNSVNYYGSGATSTQAQQGFRTERGSEIGSISTTGLTLDLAESVDTLQFFVGPQSSTVSSSVATYGPYKVGQATNIANVSIASVNASCALASTPSSCSVSGVANLTAVPSVTQAVTPVKLDTSTTPLAVLDSNANNASTLILVGSKYVNSVSAQVFAQNPSLDSSFGPSSVVVQAFGTNRILVAGYSANQTVQAGNQFIQDLLTAASS